MTTIGDKIKHLEDLQNGITGLAAETFTETKDAFQQLNTQQMYEGKTSDGSEIAPPYAASTVRIKKRKGQPYDRVTFRDTGRFYDGYQLQVNGDQLSLSSDAEYTKYLEQRSGTAIWGLDDENRPKYTFGAFWSVLKGKVQELGFKL